MPGCKICIVKWFSFHPEYGYAGFMGSCVWDVGSLGSCMVTRDLLLMSVFFWDPGYSYVDFILPWVWFEQFTINMGNLISKKALHHKLFFAYNAEYSIEK